ncbi:MAG TPA: hypothetical protein VHV10_11585 [Ktedonobacteraceae bacterium]|nr:hypothetical protein [Ktedonobacteraceae bacterium]
MKYKILRLVFRNKEEADSNVGLLTQRSQSNAVQALEYLKNRRIKKTNTCPGTQYPKQLVELPERVPQLTSQDFNNLFPGVIEQVYDRPIRQNRRKRKFFQKVIAPNGTSFLDLPRELRNEIYRYAVVSDQVYKIRARATRKDSTDNKKTRERLPPLYHVSLQFEQEVLEAHYRHNTIRYTAVHNHDPDVLLSWIQRRGPELVKHIRRMEVVHPFNVERIRLYTRCVIKTTIEQRSDGTVEVSTAHPRAIGSCHCGIAELVQERLLRDDAQANAECLRRIEQSAQYGPVLGFALQLLEAVQLGQTHEATMSRLSAAAQFQYHREFTPDCILCGKRKWVLRH